MQCLSISYDIIWYHRVGVLRRNKKVSSVFNLNNFISYPYLLSSPWSPPSPMLLICEDINLWYFYFGFLFIIASYVKTNLHYSPFIVRRHKNMLIIKLPILHVDIKTRHISVIWIWNRRFSQNLPFDADNKIAC